MICLRAPHEAASSCLLSFPAQGRRHGDGLAAVQGNRIDDQTPHMPSAAVLQIHWATAETPPQVHSSHTVDSQLPARLGSHHLAPWRRANGGAVPGAAERSTGSAGWGHLDEASGEWVPGLAGRLDAVFCAARCDGQSLPFCRWWRRSHQVVCIRCTALYIMLAVFSFSRASMRDFMFATHAAVIECK